MKASYENKRFQTIHKNETTIESIVATSYKAERFESSNGRGMLKMGIENSVRDL